MSLFALIVQSLAMITQRVAARPRDLILRLDIVAFCALTVVVIDGPIRRQLRMERFDLWHRLPSHEYQLFENTQLVSSVQPIVPRSRNVNAVL